MAYPNGKYTAPSQRRHWQIPAPVIPLSFFLIEVFGYAFLGKLSLWPLAFGGAWMLILTGILGVLPGIVSRVLYGILYFVSLAYAIVQTGYYLLFGEMMWISDFRYASEGSDYFDILLSYPVSWWLSMLALLILGGIILWRYPKGRYHWCRPVLAMILAGLGIFYILNLPPKIFEKDSDIQYAKSDYGRMQSSRAAYENMFNTHRLYQVCGLYQTAVKDICTNYLYPLTPDYRQAQENAHAEIDAYFAAQSDSPENDMTGLLKDKNIIFVLMESMDDWMIGEHTPTIQAMMEEGIHFTNFYTPGFGGIRTFNTEFAINTGSFLSSQGGYAFDYVTNTFQQSLASLMGQQGYRAMTYHYNDPSFYSRGVFSPAMGYEEYICYADFVEPNSKELYDDQLLFDNVELSDHFFAYGKKLNFVITRSAHLSYKYNEVLSHWGLKRYPEYKGLTGNEETDCAYLKAKLVDDFFARLLYELEIWEELDNTVIVAVTDHYTYGYKNTPALMELSGVTDSLLLEKTPCFIWGAGVPDLEVSKVMNTTDFVPTLLNLLGMESPYDYIGRDVFDDGYDGFVPFSDGSWIYDDIAYNAGTKSILSVSGKKQTVSPELREKLDSRVAEFIRINNLILETDYYRDTDS